MQQNEYPVEQILSGLKINSLNEMQQASIGANQQHKDVILLSSTGSGKTLAFLLPVLQTLTDVKNIQALIIVPSRELAQQIETVFKSLSTSFKVTCCYGGHSRQTEENNLIQPPALLIGTPGRIADHIRRGNVILDHVKTLVLDEFDKSLELGFSEEMTFILGSLRSLEKRILTSATESLEIPSFVGLKNPVKLNYLSGALPHRLTVKAVLADEKDKIDTLFRLICFLGGKSTIIFCNHRESVERISAFLTARKITNEFYHGALEQQERDSALAKFRNGSVYVLVATDLASRGLDIPDIQYIVHYHLPQTGEAFMHRNGRTARMGASGTVIVILSPGEELPFVEIDAGQLQLPETSPLPPAPAWVTIFFSGGKKDKINKIDIAGFLSHKAGLKKDEIGLIEVRDFFSFAAVKRSRAGHALQLIKNEKIKNKKVKIELAK